MKFGERTRYLMNIRDMLEGDIVHIWYIHDKTFREKL